LSAATPTTKREKPIPKIPFEWMKPMPAPKRKYYLEYTNELEEGVFSNMKNMISLHRGLSKNLKLTLVDYYLVNYKKK
jgi:hypothetical protein